MYMYTLSQCRARIYCLSAFPGKVKNCGGKAKVLGRFSARKVPVLNYIDAQKLGFLVGKVEIGAER